jgi:serine protease Do
LTDIVKETESATFIIYTYDEFGSPKGSGSGFFVAADGVGVTNYHVLDKTIKAVIKLSDGSEHEINNVISSDKDWDIAIFRVKNPDSKAFSVLKFANKPVQKGEKVYNISSPMGLESSLSEGIVSSCREHGKTVQVTAPISSGSSGSAILNEKGEVFAVATFIRRGGQNLNFGVMVDKESVMMMKQNDFVKTNKKFNSGYDFVLLNVKSDTGSDIMLNAIDFGETVTTLYMSYTHLLLIAGGKYSIWCELNTKDEGFFIEDTDSDVKYYVTSSTIGVDKTHGTEVALPSTTRFKVYLPAINGKINRINVYGCGQNDSRWRFTNVDLNKYREAVNLDFENYSRNYALASMQEGELSNARDMLSECIENDPDDVVALNTMGIISYTVDNNQDALYYFTQAIESSPNDELGYVNRYAVYTYQKNYSSALEDINKAISLNPDQPDYIGFRAHLYMELQDWQKAKEDIDTILSTNDFNNDAGAYYLRGLANAWLKNIQEACGDLSTAYKLNDPNWKNDILELWNNCGCDQRSKTTTKSQNKYRKR